MFGVSTIRVAAARLDGRIVRTPLLESPLLNELTGARVFVKAECLQLTGSFKIRGALNRALTMPDEERARGLVAFSAGNHGQGVAAAARLLGIPAVVVMPTTAPKVKIKNCQWWGAEVVLFDPSTDDREEVSGAIVRDRGMALIPPFDDHDVMSGQGTVGLEIAEDLDRYGITPDAVLVNASGGGLASGVIEILRDRYPSIDAIIVEPAGRDKLGQSLAIGRPVSLAPSSTIMDALAGPSVGEKTLSALARHRIRAVTVTDDQALYAMASAFTTLRIVVEPGGAASLAAALADDGLVAGRTVVVVASGGNVDPETFTRALAVGGV